MLKITDKYLFDNKYLKLGLDGFSVTKTQKWRDLVDPLFEESIKVVGNERIVTIITPDKINKAFDAEIKSKRKTNTKATNRV
jgi:hypothetical protein